MLWSQISFQSCTLCLLFYTVTPPHLSFHLRTHKHTHACTHTHTLSLSAHHVQHGSSCRPDRWLVPRSRRNEVRVKNKHFYNLITFTCRWSDRNEAHLGGPPIQDGPPGLIYPADHCFTLKDIELVALLSGTWWRCINTCRDFFFFFYIYIYIYLYYTLYIEYILYIVCVCVCVWAIRKTIYSQSMLILILCTTKLLWLIAELWR